MVELDILAAHAAAQPEKVALVCGSQRVSFRELFGLARRATAVLKELAVEPGDRVALMSFNSIETVVLGHAIRRLGAVGVPINYRLREREVAHVLNDSGATVVAADPEHLPVVQESLPLLERAELRLVVTHGDPPPGWLSFDALLAATAEDEAPPRDSALGASLIYTSGTTGAPKAAYRPQGLPLDALLEIIALFELTPDDVFLMAGPSYHSANLLFALLHQGIGATIVLMPRFDAAEALRLISVEHITTSCLAPTMLRRLCDLPRSEFESADLGSLRALILVAAPCPFELKRRAVERLGNVLWEFYGATETGVNILLRPEDQLRKPGSCGQAVAGTEVRLLDENGNEVPTGVPGELWVRSPWLAGYYNRPDATAANTRDGFFSVGDVAYVDADGYYYVCDRKVDMIISGGANIYPAEVEAVLHQHPAVADAAVIGVPDEEWGESVKAIVVARPDSTVDQRELIDFCAERLASYKKPRAVEFVAELPRDPAGKILKRELRERHWTASGRRI